MAPVKLAIIGDRGIPARYSGFSTLVEQLATRLVAEHDFDVTVYCRTHYYEDRPALWNGVRCVYLPAPGGKSFESIVHSNLAIGHAALRGFDVAFIVDPGNGPFAMPMVLRGIPTLYHTDGIGWQRRKWSPMQQRYYRWSEKVTARLATWLVTDSHAMGDYYVENYGAPSSFVPYSGEVGDDPDPQALAHYGLEPGGYYLAVARMEPENNLDLVIREYKRTSISKPLVVVGGTPYPNDYTRSVMAEADDRVKMLGSVFESGRLNALYAHCAAYMHGHEVGGTNPSLLRAMHWGAPCIPIDVVFHKEVLGANNPAFTRDRGDLAALLTTLDADPARRDALGRSAKARSDGLYRWDAVVDGYATILRQLVKTPGRKAACAALEGQKVYHPERFHSETMGAASRRA